MPKRHFWLLNLISRMSEKRWQNLQSNFDAILLRHWLGTKKQIA
jgi:hypothetical protein